MNPTARTFLLLGALSAALSVALGAVGAHSPHPAIAAQLPLLQTAVQYQQFHAVGLLVAGLLAREQSGWPLTAAGVCFVAGTVLFSGNLCLRVFADIQDFRRLVPLGGMAFILGWVLLAWACTGRASRQPQSTKP